MEITQEELQRRLNSNKNLVNKILPNKNLPNKKGNDSNNRNDAGRKEDIPNAPEYLRGIAGITAKIDGNAQRTAAALDLTAGQVRYAEKSIEPISEKKVQDIALARLMDSLNLLTPIKMADEKPKELSAIAANLSRVHKNLTPINTGSNNGVVINIYSPKRRELNDYESIEVQTGT